MKTAWMAVALSLLASYASAASHEFAQVVGGIRYSLSVSDEGMALSRWEGESLHSSIRMNVDQADDDTPYTSAELEDFLKRWTGPDGRFDLASLLSEPSVARALEREATKVEDYLRLYPQVVAELKAKGYEPIDGFSMPSGEDRAEVLARPLSMSKPLGGGTIAMVLFNPRANDLRGIEGGGFIGLRQEDKWEVFEGFVSASELLRKTDGLRLTY